MSARRSSLDTLRALPGVFDLRDLSVALGLERRDASNMCGRWATAGLVKPAGPRAGVFFNLVVDPDAPDRLLLDAVRRVVRRPVFLVGGSALHAHGWTTQRHQRTEIAFPADRNDRSVPKIAGVVAVGRHPSWFASVASSPRYAKRDDAVGYGGFPLPPAEWVLVDAIAAKRVPGGMWKPAPDDLELPPDLDPERVMARIERAAAELGADLEEVREFVSKIDGLEDVADGPPRP